MCSLCEQMYHGVVRCALGWACWKTYVGRPETDALRVDAMTVLGSGLSAAGHHKDALSVREAELSTKLRLGVSGQNILVSQTNLANSYHVLGRLEQALQLERDVYYKSLRLLGEEAEDTLISVNNYADSLFSLNRVEEAKSLLCKMIPVARRVSGDDDENTLKMRWNYAKALYINDSATLDDVHEAVTTLTETARIARRVLGGAHPLTTGIEVALRRARDALRARETPPSSA